MALFSKKQEDKSETKYEVSSDAPKTSGAPAIRIPSILIQPRISEKAAHQAKMNKYVFKVATSANKVEVKKAVEAAYKVRVTQVNIVRNLGKARTFGNRVGRTQAFKKAIVTLREGDSIQGLTDVV